MAIRLRKVENVLIALCAAETNPLPGDIYLDDHSHYALAAKFARDWAGHVITWKYEHHDHLANTQKLRDAETELRKWFDEIGVADDHR